MKPRQETKPENKEKSKERRFLRDTVDPKNDPVLKTALEWLKSDLTAKQFKLENVNKPSLGDAARSTK